MKFRILTVVAGRIAATIAISLFTLLAAVALSAKAAESECARIGFFRTTYIPGTYGIFTPPNFKKIKKECSEVRLPIATKRERIITGYLALLELNLEHYRERADIPLQSYAFAAGAAELLGHGEKSYDLLVFAAQRGEPNAIFSLVKGAPLFQKRDDNILHSGLDNLIDKDIDEDNSCFPLYALYLQSSSDVLHEIQYNSERIVHRTRQILKEKCLHILTEGQRRLLFAEPWKVNPWVPKLLNR